MTKDINYPQRINVTVSLTLSKSLPIQTTAYSYENGTFYYDKDDYTDELRKEVTLPHELASKVRYYFETHPELKMSKDLEKAVQNCENWDIDDIVTIPE